MRELDPKLLDLSFYAAKSGDLRDLQSWKLVNQSNNEESGEDEESFEVEELEEDEAEEAETEVRWISISFLTY